jgi:hypothetical protein
MPGRLMDLPSDQPRGMGQPARVIKPSVKNRLTQTYQVANFLIANGQFVANT